MNRMGADKLDGSDPQRRHWDSAYAANPEMYGGQPSAPAIQAATVFRDAGAHDVLELGAGHGRDALFFAQQGFAVHFFTGDLVGALGDGCTLIDVHAFEEGDLPRQLWRITQTLAR